MSPAHPDSVAQTVAQARQTEDLALLHAAQTGDNQAMEILLSHYKGLVRHKAASMFIAGADAEDVIQEGMIGLFKAIRSYDPTLGVNFAAFASRCIAAQITDAVRQASRQKHRPLNESLSLQGLQQGAAESGTPPGTLDWPDSDQDPEKLLLSREQAADFQTFIRQNLSSLEQQVLQLYLQGLPYQQIADHLDCSSKRVDNALHRARQKIATFSKGTAE